MARQPAAPEATPQRIRILLVDDHPLVREGIAQRIDEEPDLEVCGEAAGVCEARAKIAAVNPDLVLVDLTLAEGSGLALIKQIRASNPDVKTLVLSMHDEEVFAERALNAGASGYVSKQVAARTLVDAIRTVCEGKIYLSDPMTARFMQKACGQATMECSVRERLSDRELEVYEQIGRGLSNREIGVRLHMSTKTVDSHRAHIKSKLDLISTRDVARHAMQWVIEGR